MKGEHTEMIIVKDGYLEIYGEECTVTPPRKIIHVEDDIADPSEDCLDFMEFMLAEKFLFDDDYGLLS